MATEFTLVKVVSNQLRVLDRVVLPPDLLAVATKVQRKLAREGRPVVVSGNNQAIVIEKTAFELITN